MRIQYLSDVHLEMRGSLPAPEVPVAAPVLVLAGDIGDPRLVSYRAFLRACGEGRERVFLVAGNHEYYGSDVGGALERLRAACADLPTPTTLLEGFRAHEHGGVLFAGDTLWSLPEERLRHKIRDFSRIRDFSPAAARGLHEAARARLGALLASLAPGPARRPLVLVTHHAPARAMQGRFAGNDLESAFWSDMGGFAGPPVAVWVSGHTHQSVRWASPRGTLCVSNCMGYPGEAGVGYDPRAAVEVEVPARADAATCAAARSG